MLKKEFYTINDITKEMELCSRPQLLKMIEEKTIVPSSNIGTKTNKFWRFHKNEVSRVFGIPLDEDEGMAPAILKEILKELQEIKTTVKQIEDEFKKEAHMDASALNMETYVPPLDEE